MQQQHGRPEPFRAWRRVMAVLAALTLVSVAACIQDGAEPGAFSGPSELGLSLALTASPDRLPLDGASQSVIGVHARDENGNNVANLANGARYQRQCPVRRQWVGGRKGSDDHRVQLELWRRQRVQCGADDLQHVYAGRHLRGATDRYGQRG